MLKSRRKRNLPHQQLHRRRKRKPLLHQPLSSRKLLRPRNLLPRKRRSSNLIRKNSKPRRSKANRGNLKRHRSKRRFFHHQVRIWTYELER